MQYPLLTDSIIGNFDPMGVFNTMNETECTFCDREWKPRTTWKQGAWTDEARVAYKWTRRTFASIRSIQPTIDYTFFAEVPMVLSPVPPSALNLTMLCISGGGGRCHCSLGFVV